MKLLKPLMITCMVATLLMFSAVVAFHAPSLKDKPRHDAQATITLKQAAVPAASEAARIIKAASRAPAPTFGQPRAITISTYMHTQAADERARAATTHGGSGLAHMSMNGAQSASATTVLRV